MRYWITIVFLIIVIITTYLQISLVLAASIVEWEADHNTWSQVEAAEEQEPNAMGQVLQAQTGSQQCYHRVYPGVEKFYGDRLFNDTIIKKPGDRVWSAGPYDKLEFFNFVPEEHKRIIEETLYITSSQHIVVDGSENQAKNDLEELQGVKSSSISAYVHHVFLPLVISGEECTVTFNPGSIRYDGRDVAPGAVICLNGGHYSKVTFRNLRGTAAKPITVRNHGGQVVVSRDAPMVYFVNCQHVHFTGMGAEGIKYGIKVLDEGIGIISYSTAFEVDHIELTGRMTIKDVDHPDHEMSDIYIHHNYIHDVGPEAIYIGSSFYNDHPDDFLMRRVEVAHNRVENVGDGIQVGSVVEGCVVHHNRIYDVNPDPDRAHHGAIIINQGADCDVYNNIVVDSGGSGIISRDKYFSHRIYNNLVVNTGHTLDTDRDGIFVGGDNYSVYHNTVIDAERFGIAFKGTGTNNSAFNNIILGTGDDPIRKGGSVDENFHHNLIKDEGYTPADFGFVDPASDDYRLIKDSPAVDAGADSGLRWDLDDRPRPVGVACDIGAYEF